MVGSELPMSKDNEMYGDLAGGAARSDDDGNDGGDGGGGDGGGDGGDEGLGV